MRSGYKYKYIKLKEIKGTREENIYIIAFTNGMLAGSIMMLLAIF